MTSEGHTPSPAPGNRVADMLGNLLTGLRVLGGEMKWLALKGLRSLEIRQMEKRLAEEFQALGRAVAGALDGAAESESAPLDDEARLSLKQIAFLNEEVAFLRKERDRLREDLLQKRREDLNRTDKPQPSQE